MFHHPVLAKLLIPCSIFLLLTGCGSSDQIQTAVDPAPEILLEQEPLAAVETFLNAWHNADYPTIAAYDYDENSIHADVFFNQVLDGRMSEDDLANQLAEGIMQSLYYENVTLESEEEGNAVVYASITTLDYDVLLEDASNLFFMVALSDEIDEADPQDTLMALLIMGTQDEETETIQNDILFHCVQTIDGGWKIILDDATVDMLLGGMISAE